MAERDFIFGHNVKGDFAEVIKIELDTGGSVWKILKEAGGMVDEGDALFILEVMKMEVIYESPKSGKLIRWYVNEGDSVEEGQVVAEILAD